MDSFELPYKDNVVLVYVTNNITVNRECIYIDIYCNTNTLFIVVKVFTNFSAYHFKTLTCFFQ